ncbi:MAG: DEAD/DEAH box helicase, partial [Gemmatimonadales bacterium]
AGRVHGRVPNGEVVILSDRKLVFSELKPTPPEFQLAGDAERVALTCAAIGVDARDLDLPVPLDRTAYRRSIERLTSRGLIDQGRLTGYGKEVEALPTDRPWAELLVHGEDHIIPVLAVGASLDSLHRMTREERDLHGVMVNGSDHLTMYNIYAEAVEQHGYVGRVYGLPRHLFDDGLEEWAELRGVLVKAMEDAALGVASIYRAIDLPLPERFARATKEMQRDFRDLVARIMPFDLVIDEHTADGQEARVSRSSVAGSWGAVAGNLRYFADRMGIPRAAIEGTTLPYDLVRQHAVPGPARIELSERRRSQHLMLRRAVSYFGFELETVAEDLSGNIPDDLLNVARDALVSALLAGETIHSDQGRIRRSLETLGELWRRSGGTLPQISAGALREALRGQVDEMKSWEEFLQTPLGFDPEALVQADIREALFQLPDSVHLMGDAVPLDYDLDAEGRAIVRLRMREGQARRLKERDLPALDRPMRFTVVRGTDGSVRADSLDEMRRLLVAMPRGNRGKPTGRKGKGSDHSSGGGPGGRGRGKGRGKGRGRRR